MSILDEIIGKINGIAARVSHLERLENGTGSGTVTEGPGIDLVTDQVGLGGDTVLLYDSGGDPVVEFAATGAGLDLALAAAGSGDVLQLPAVSIDGDHTLIAGVKVVGLSRFATILSGQITAADGASLENLSVTRAANDANDLIGMIGPASGTFRLHNCHVSAAQSGAGNAYGIEITGNGNVEAWGCSIVATTGADGYAGYFASGTGRIYAFGGRLYGSTGTFNV